jgi:glyoxylase-like metal-dependent hydrolase (beta-lactamase superfamily II)
LAQKIELVKPGLYVVTGSSNTTVRVTSEGLILVDSKPPSQMIYNGIVSQIRTVTDQPFRYLINTHHHFDHTGNNGLFQAAGAKVIGQKNLYNTLATYEPPPNPGLGNLAASALPDITYDTRYTVHLGGKTVELFHYGPGHTSGDTVAYFPDLKVVCMGDLLAPYLALDYRPDSSIKGWAYSIEQALKLDWDKAIPGHSNPNNPPGGDVVFTRDQVVAYREKILTLLDRASAQIKAGTPKDRLIENVKMDDLWKIPAGYWTPQFVNILWTEAGGK